MKKDTKNVTIKHIAEYCGVSSMTVTRAFRSDASVNKETRNRILKMSEELGYQPRVSMGRPRHKGVVERDFIEVILGKTVHSVFYYELLSVIESELAERKYDCIIRSANGKFDEFVKLCEVLRASPSSPTLVVGYLPLPQLRALLEARPAALLVDHTGDSRLELPYSSIGFDNVEAARMMMRHLLSSGRKRILLLNGFADHYFSRDMEYGYREALENAELAVDQKLIIETDFTPECAIEKLNRLLDEKLVFDAVLTNDEMATGVIYALHKRGISVPGDIAVAGCDGLPLGQYTVPSLTTMLLDYKSLGRMAVENIFEKERECKPVYRIRLLPCIEVRESTAGSR